MLRLSVASRLEEGLSHEPRVATKELDRRQVLTGEEHRPVALHGLVVRAPGEELHQAGRQALRREPAIFPSRVRAIASWSRLQSPPTSVPVAMTQAYSTSSG